jgi:hypothetical protein
MKEGYFDCLRLPVTKGLSGDQLHLRVEALDHRRGVLLLGAEVVEDQVAVREQHLRLGLHRGDRAAHDHLAPAVEELARPGGRAVGPEVVEVLLEDVGAGGPQVQAKEVAEPAGLLGGQVARPLEQAPSRVLSGRRRSSKR